MLTIDRLQKAFQKWLYDNPTRLLRIMVAILVLQLAWWVVFYELDYQKTDALQSEVDTIYGAILEGRISTIQVPGYIWKENGTATILPDVLNNRAITHWRKLAMLASETFFVILVVSLGARQIIVSIEKEKRLLRERDIFINSVTHELKTPLAILLLNIQTLQKRKLSEEKKAQLLHDSVENIYRLESQVNNILLSSDLLNKRAAREEKEIRPLDLQKETLHFLSANEKLFQRENASIYTDFSGLNTTPSVKIEGEMYQKVLSNLIQNAIQYGSEQPEIRITMKNTGRDLEILISDNGPGIAKEERESIFQPFYRLNNDNRIIRGTGLGLHLVREIVQAASGTIQIIDSETGTTFAVRFSLIRDDNLV